jgi:hypothetical protein
MKFNWVNHNWVEVGSDLGDSPGMGGVFHGEFVENSLRGEGSPGPDCEP